MTVEEFSNEFDTLILAYLSTLLFGETNNIAFDEYEKSTFLTKSQEEIVIEFYSGKNPNGDSFEKTEEIRRYLNNLIKSYLGNKVNFFVLGLTDYSQFFSIPSDVWFITYESAILLDNSNKCINESVVPVIPVKYDEFHRTLNNPFRGASESRVLRLDLNGEIVELISNYNISKYLIRYVSKPSPIIVEDLPLSLSINNINKKTECCLNSALHRLILDRAVRMALASKSIIVNNLNKL